MTVFLIDTMEIEGFVLACLPIIMMGIGVFLIVLSAQKHKQRKNYATTLVLGVLALLFPLLIAAFLFFAFWLGGPAMN